MVNIRHNTDIGHDKLAHTTSIRVNEMKLLLDELAKWHSNKYLHGKYILLIANLDFLYVWSNFQIISKKMKGYI